MMFKKHSLLFAVEGGGAGAGNLPPAEMGKEEVIKFLGMDDEKVEPLPIDDKVKKDEKEEKPNEPDDDEVVEEEKEEVEEVDELKEIEESLKEEVITDEQLELVTPVSRKEILKKYPQLFKDFPHLEKAFYRNYQFTELFPTLDEAKEAYAKSNTLDQFDKDLLAGNTEGLLQAAKKSSETAFNKIVDNYLTTLMNVDKDAAYHVTGNIIKQTVLAMIHRGRSSGEDKFIELAEDVYEFVFGTKEFEPVKKLSKEETKDNSAENELKIKQQAFNKQRFDTANADLSRVVENSLKATIAANIDPKNSMTDFVKRHASNEVLSKVESILAGDKQFTILLDKLWESAEKNNYSKESTDKIRNAFFAKAKTLLPAAIKSARNEALKGNARRSKDDDSVKEEKEEKVDRPERTRSSNKDDKKGVPAGMSTLEYLMKD